ncbi:MAG: YkgJ family cysteine cluster protein [Acidobacteria bacterium]|nr:YkgJ family cysteine cluster protein [Acidobacteriota bacterium]
MCPFLDPAAGACQIYAHRPPACRTYGYYADSRGVGLYCSEIRRREEAGKLAAVVRGNHDAMEAKIDAIGPRVSFADWAQSRG